MIPAPVPVVYAALVDPEAGARAGIALIFLNYVRTHQGELQVVTLDMDMHVGGRWYADEARSTCVVPISIQSTWLAGSDRKVRRLREYGQWFLAEDDHSCASNAPADVVQSVAKWVKCPKSGLVGRCGPGCIGTHLNGRFWARPLDASSVVYSFGIGEDLSFEIGLAARYGVTIHLFDPSPKAKYHVLWVQDILEKGWSDRNAPTFRNISTYQYLMLVRSSSLKREQLIFHHVGLSGRSDGEASFCFPRSSEHSEIRNVCHGMNCTCDGESVGIQTMDQIFKNLGYIQIELLVLNVREDEASVVEHLKELESLPRHVMVELDEESSLLSWVSAVLGQYNLVKLQGRYATWKLRRYKMQKTFGRFLILVQ